VPSAQRVPLRDGPGAERPSGNRVASQDCVRATDKSVQCGRLPPRHRRFAHDRCHRSPPWCLLPRSLQFPAAARAACPSRSSRACTRRAWRWRCAPGRREAAHQVRRPPDIRGQDSKRQPQDWRAGRCARGEAEPSSSGRDREITAPSRTPVRAARTTRLSRCPGPSEHALVHEDLVARLQGNIR
jgi:hypothetical protein